MEKFTEMYISIHFINFKILNNMDQSVKLSAWDLLAAAVFASVDRNIHSVVLTHCPRAQITLYRGCYVGVKYLSAALLGVLDCGFIDLFVLLPRQLDPFSFASASTAQLLILCFRFLTTVTPAPQNQKLEMDCSSTNPQILDYSHSSRTLQILNSMMVVTVHARSHPQMICM